MSCFAVQMAGPRVVAVVGPTAVGKSALAMRLARDFDGEIVNADAFQFYRGMDIGTAKPGRAEQAEIRHHCIDILDISEPASVAHFQRTARSAIAAITARGRLPVVVGGSALYVRALCDELEIPPNDPEVRARLARQAEEHGAAAMHHRLAQVDAEAATLIDPRNVRRVVRALEVVELTGSFTARLPEPRSWHPTLWLAPDLDRSELDSRIMARTAQMWRDDLPGEVRDLMRQGLADAPTAAKAVGYSQAMAEIRGELTREQAIDATIVATRKLARRQQRTFRGDERIRWLPDPASATGVLAEWLATPLS